MAVTFDKGTVELGRGRKSAVRDTRTLARRVILYNIVSRRHEQRSTITSTDLAFKHGGTTFPGAACVVALVDRFAQHCHCVEIIGKHRLDPDRPKPTSPKSRSKRGSTTTRGARRCNLMHGGVVVGGDSHG